MSALNASLSTDTPAHIPNPNLNPTTTLPSDVAHNTVAVLASDLSAPPATSPNGTPLRLYTVTPLIHSPQLSTLSGHNIYLKLDCLQPSASFKMRGISQEVLAAHRSYGSATHVIISSGGNAGLAAATASKALGVRCTVFVPVTTEQEVIATLRGLGSEVQVVGNNWNEADEQARILVAQDEAASYIHAFEGEELINGHASLSKEIYEQFGEERRKAGAEAMDGQDGEDGRGPEVIVCSSGGGGLIHGILRGITDIQRSQTSASTTTSIFQPLVISCQDTGANSLNASFDRYLSDPTHPTGPITLEAITSKATSMGTRTCGSDNLAAVIQYSKDGTLGDIAFHDGSEQADNKHGRYLRTLTLDDCLSGSAAWQFYRDHSLIVEMACGAALAPVYAPELLKALLDSLPLGGNDKTGNEPAVKRNVVIVVCGGSKTSIGILEGYKEAYGEMKGRATVDGTEIIVG